MLAHHGRRKHEYSLKLFIIKDLNGGGHSLQRTRLWIEFPANREKYREFSQLRYKNLAGHSVIRLNMHQLSPSMSNPRVERNREISLRYQGIVFP